ncbi:fibronectin type III-like domain-contianing protein [Paenibacillus sp. YAF4_2]|uniref:fibronectin type III-like domain-contianing protein n=1 Tax=Paenibacillus sp. YAF4_2 TaxID=3233085 RepID=UPI003F9B30E3
MDLEPGETKEVSFQITEEDLKYHDKQLRYCAEEGSSLYLSVVTPRKCKARCLN